MTCGGVVHAVSQNDLHVLTWMHRNKPTAVLYRRTDEREIEKRVRSLTTSAECLTIVRRKISGFLCDGMVLFSWDLFLRRMRLVVPVDHWLNISHRALYNKARIELNQTRPGVSCIVMYVNLAEMKGTVPWSL